MFQGVRKSANIRYSPCLYYNLYNFFVMSTIDAVIETPKGSAQKYDFDPVSRFFKLKKILPSGMVFPYDFGFIPGTKGDDGDPLDVIAISEFSSLPGIVMECRLLGCILAVQSVHKGSDKMVHNDRFLAVPEYSTIFSNFRSIGDIPDKIFQEIEAFFKNYNKLEGKQFKILSTAGHNKAAKMIQSGITG